MTAQSRSYIAVSSSSSSEEEEEEDVDSGEDALSWISSSYDERELSEETDFDDDSDVLKADAEPCCNRVIKFLEEGRDLCTLRMEECKAYLRRHRLRLAGTKKICIQRICEHWRIKDGNGEEVYPRSSFVINCTGDVCMGDVVLFRQRIYTGFDLAKKKGNCIGKRVIAGRIVKESYGATRQQHTFTVEILWSKGVKPLPPLFPLLVKGRNLYRLRTFRQRWADEREREKVLTEKHERGAEARKIRAKAQSVCSKSKRPRLTDTKKFSLTGRIWKSDTSKREDACFSRCPVPKHRKLVGDVLGNFESTLGPKRKENYNNKKPHGKRKRNGNELVMASEQIGPSHMLMPSPSYMKNMMFPCHGSGLHAYSTPSYMESGFPSGVSVGSSNVPFLHPSNGNNTFSVPLVYSRHHVDHAWFPYHAPWY